MFEGVNSFTAAKYLFSQNKSAICREYAERAIRETPDSVEAMHLWAQCQPRNHRISSHIKMLDKFRNFARGHEFIARNYLYPIDEPKLAIEHMQKAMLLDSRIKGDYLGEAYYKIGEWEKAIAVFQGLSEIYDFPILHFTYLQEAQLKLNGLADLAGN